MNTEELSACLTFIREAERLKNVHRSAYTSTGKQESTAEHTWRLCLLGMAIALYTQPAPVPAAGNAQLAV